MVEIHDLQAGYPGNEVLKGISMTIPAGAVTALLGPNGCGKTTLLKTLCGILPVTSGTVTLDGQSLLTLPRQMLAQKVAYLAQSRQVPEITAYRLVLHGRFPYLSYPRRYRPQDHAAAQRAMEQLGIWELRDTLLSHLSGGQRQKVYIAMALAQDTPVILMDEPTTYLDIRHQLRLMGCAKELAATGKTILLVSHDLPSALQTADQVILMDQGRLTDEGSAEALWASGKIDQVFGIKTGSIDTPDGRRYYCTEG